MNNSALALIGLTAIVVGLVGFLAFATRRIFAAARSSTQRASDTQNVMMSTAFEEAIGRLRKQERETAERAEASERVSGQIITSLASGLIVVGLDGHVQIVNPAARWLLGLGDHSLSGNYRSVIGEPVLSETIDECLSSAQPIVRRTVALPDKSTPPTHLGVTVSPLFDAAKQLQGAVCLFSDVSAVQQLEAQLRLKEGLAAVGELTAGIAHEFRNGLATIHGYAMLIDPAVLPVSMRPCIEGIRAEALSLGDVVTKFLDFARPTQLALSEVDLGSLCQRAVDEYADDVRQRGGVIEMRGEFGYIQGDEVLLHRTFSNLVRNAVDACAGASRPHIVVESSLDCARGVCTVVVDDNGPGVPAELRERVFQPFFTSKGHGTGLGLALVQKFVVSHNGRVSVGTSPLGGARLQVVLPIAVNAAA